MKKKTIVALVVLGLLVLSVLGVWIYSSNTSTNQPSTVITPPGANTPPIGGGCGVAQANNPNSGNGIVRGPVL